MNLIKNKLKHSEAFRLLILFLPTLFSFYGSATPTSLICFILILSIISLSWAYYRRVYKTLQCTIFLFFSLSILLFLPGVSGIYFLVCSFTSILLYSHKKILYFYDIGILSVLGFSISFLLFKLYLLWEIESILFTAQHLIVFTGNPEDLTVTCKIMLENSYLAYPENQLQLLLNKNGFVDALTLLTKFKPVESSTNFVAIYAFFINWIANFIPFIKVYFIIT